MMILMTITSTRCPTIYIAEGMYHFSFGFFFSARLSRIALDNEITVHISSYERFVFPLSCSLCFARSLIILSF